MKLGTQNISYKMFGAENGKRLVVCKLMYAVMAFVIAGNNIFADVSVGFCSM